MDTVNAPVFPMLDQGSFPPLPQQVAVEIPAEITEAEKNMLLAAVYLLEACIKAQAWHAVSLYEFKTILAEHGLFMDKRNSALQGLRRLARKKCISERMHVTSGRDGVTEEMLHYTPEVPMIMLLGLFPPLPLTLPANVLQIQS